MEVAVYKFEHLLTIVAYILAQCAVVERAERLQYAINHRGAEYTACLEDFALTLKTIGRCCAAVG